MYIYILICIDAVHTGISYRHICPDSCPSYPQGLLSLLPISFSRHIFVRSWGASCACAHGAPTAEAQQHMDGVSGGGPASTNGQGHPLWVLDKMLSIGVFRGFHKWGYPQIIHFNRNFPHKPSILGYPILGNPHLVDTAMNTIGTSNIVQSQGTSTRVLRCVEFSNSCMGCFWQVEQ